MGRMMLLSVLGKYRSVTPSIFVWNYVDVFINKSHLPFSEFYKNVAKYISSVLNMNFIYSKDISSKEINTTACLWAVFWLVKRSTERKCSLAKFYV